MHDRIEIKIAYPLKFLWVTIMWHKRIGFAFTNLAMFVFREDQKIDDSEQYKAWLKEHGQAVFINEMLFSAAKAYCMHEHIKENFTKTNLLAGIALSSQEIQEQIMLKWKNSETFGLAASKKKVKTRK